MTTDIFKGDSTVIASCGSENPVVAMMAQMILSQKFAPLQVSNAKDVGAQSVGTAGRSGDLGR